MSVGVSCVKNTTQKKTRITSIPFALLSLSRLSFNLYSRSTPRVLIEFRACPALSFLIRKKSRFLEDDELINVQVEVEMNFSFGKRERASANLEF